MPDLRKRKFKLLRKRPPKPLPPLNAQVVYLKALKEMMAYARELVHTRVLSRLPALLDVTKRLTKDGSVDVSYHVDADPHGKVNRLLDRASEVFFERYPAKRLQTIGQKIAELTSAHQKEQLLSQVRQTIGIKLETLADTGLRDRIKRFTAENVALIETVPQKYFDDVEKVVLKGMREGARAPEIAADMQEQFEISESRAKLIARDQVLKFNGELNEARQGALGIDRYIWRTVGDNRVRSEHDEREGQIYSWDSPPGDPSDPAAGGHPGEAINCRCYAEPILPGMEPAEE